jgi:plasmid stabilization system protein ParE
MTNYRFTFSAVAELRAAILYYEEQENELRTAFLDEVEATLQRILHNPNAWNPLYERSRCCRTHRLPFGLIYQIRTEEILITAVMDLRRDPQHWRDLL